MWDLSEVVSSETCLAISYALWAFAVHELSAKQAKD